VLRASHQAADQTDDEPNQALTSLQSLHDGLGLGRQPELLDELEVRPKLHG